VKVLASLCLALLTLALAAEPARALLADRHKANGMGCADCHGEGPRQPVETDKCLSCHESWEALAKRTAKNKMNPHDNHVVNANGECNQCHHAHRPSEVVCAQCHQDLPFKL